MNNESSIGPEEQHTVLPDDAVFLPEEEQGGLPVQPDGKAEKAGTRRVLFWCFAVPLGMLLLIYMCLRVWPFGDNSVLVLDLNAQYVYYFEKLRNILVGGDSILYAFERNLGGEFMGMFAYYLSSPFSLLVALFPKNMMTEAIFAIFLLKCGCCGLTFGYFLTKTRKTDGLYTVVLSAMYALCSFAVVMQHNLMWTDNIIALPLLVLGIDALIREGKYRMYVLSLVYCIMSNFYIGYMSCIFVFIYFFIRYFMMTPEERNPKGVTRHFLRSFVRIGLFSVLAVAISMVIILPVYYSLSFGKFTFSTPSYEPKQLFDFLDLLTKTFFGSYDTVRPSGMPFLYCGMLMPILLPLYFFNPHFSKRKKLAYMIFLLIFAVSFNFNIADIIWHGMQRPNWLNARFAYMFIFIALVLTADSFIHLRELGLKKASVSALVWAVLLMVLQKIGYDNLPDFLAVWASLFFLAVYAVLIPWALGVKGNGDVVLCMFVCAEIMLNGVAMLYSLDADVSFTTRKSYREMVDDYSKAVQTIEDDTFYRAEKLVHRKKNDNFAVNLNGLSNSTSTLNAKVIDLLYQFGYTSESHWSMYIGANPVSDAIFGIKYIIADESANKPVMEYIHNLYELQTSTEEHLDVYQNPYALSIAYEVDDDILNYDLPPVPDPDNPEEMIDEDYVTPFEYMNGTLSAMLGREVEVFKKVHVDDTDLYNVETKFVVGHTGYKVTDDHSPRITYTFTAENNEPVFVYFPSEYPREVKLKLNGKDIGTFFENDTHAVLELGVFEEGEEVKLAMFLQDDDVYLSSGCHFFWYMDTAVFEEAVSELSEGTLAAYSDSDDEIHGTITVSDEDSVIFTSIPYDEGWKVYIDGTECETTAVLNGTLLAFDCPAGEHEIQLLYRPDAVKYGLAISVAGVVVFAGIVFVDEFRKRRGVKQAASPENGEPETQTGTDH